jgi:hypothetical protein
MAVEKELGALGDQKRGGQDIFRHCRGFERAFQVMLNEANVAFKIRAVVEGNLPETLRKIPIEKRFNKNYTREVRAPPAPPTCTPPPPPPRPAPPRPAPPPNPPPPAPPHLPAQHATLSSLPHHLPPVRRSAARPTATSPTWSPPSAASSAWWRRP